MAKRGSSGSDEGTCCLLLVGAALVWSAVSWAASFAVENWKAIALAFAVLVLIALINENRIARWVHARRAAQEAERQRQHETYMQQQAYEHERRRAEDLQRLEREREQQEIRQMLTDPGTALDNTLATQAQRAAAFEHEVASLLKRDGWHILRAGGGAGDGGIDVLAEFGGLKLGVQCKFYEEQ